MAKANKTKRRNLGARDLQIHSSKAFNLNIENEKFEVLDISGIEKSFMDFLKGIVHEVSTGGGRRFSISSNRKEVLSIAVDIVKGNLEIDKVDLIAKRLLEAEIGVQEQISRMGKKLQEGLLIICHITDRGIDKFIICKAETLSFIESTTFKQSDGFPLKKKIFKSAQITFDDQLNLEEVIINDINNAIPRYWWFNFLEVEQRWKDDENTENAFSIIDSKVLTKIKKESTADYWNIRNTTIHYFRSSEEFEIDDYIDTVLNNYTPEKEDLKIEEYKETLRGLPEKFKFDERFTLIKDVIKAKIKSTVHLHENIDLVLKGEVKVGDTIQSMITKNKEKGIFIKSNEGYDTFLQYRN